MDNDLFTYKVEVASILCDLNGDDDSEQQMSHEANDDIGYDLSVVEFTEWLASKLFNYKMMDHYTKKALWIYWIRGDDEVKLTDEKSFDFDDDDEVSEVFRIDTNNKDVPWVHERPWAENGVWKEPTPVKHYCKPFNYKSGCSEWPTCSWKDDGYCNRGNFPGAYIIGNILRYQDLEWYDALKDIKLKEEALKNKAIMEGMIEEDKESSNEGWRRWDDFDNTNRDNKSKNEMKNEDEERCEVFDDHERPVCYIRRFEMVKYSFKDDEEYVAIKENEYDDLTNTSKDAIHAYQEIFHMMDEGWTVTHTE
uniref:Uncharacterized protein n=1 Tax=Tanacetum cinerariifolium TaxID=118510 RepID=A0A699HUE1_TANCI|nr:hypothetical protein [Tanacetum cinerariifolium]